MKFKILVVLTAAAMILSAAGNNTVKQGDERFAPRLLNYQGYLTDTLSNPITNPSVSMTFAIFDAVSSGNLKWTEIQGSVGVDKGIFHTLLGGVNPIPDSVFKAGADRWLELTIGGQAFSPRTRIVSVPYAYSATFADTALYAANSAPDYDWSYRVTDGADTTLQMGGRWGIARFGNTMYGNADSTHVNFGVGSTTGANGQNYKYITVGGGWTNSARNLGSTVGGGVGNIASNICATVGGGSSNEASGTYAAVTGGRYNKARGQYSVVSGGGAPNESDSSSAIGDYSVIGGGLRNRINGAYATIGGGFNNVANGYVGTVAGGSTNAASGYIATVGGGSENIASSFLATVGGGWSNTASDTNAIVSGGYYNYAGGKYSAILGGYADTITATGDYSYLFGINSNLTQDSTFMVDMPHVWFGTEANGYEFPYGRGTDGQVMKTNGSGILSWGSIAYVDSARIAANAHKLQGKDTVDLNISYVNEGQVNSIDSLMLQNNAVTMPKISQAGATAGQVIKWNGSAWQPSADSSLDSDWSYRVTDGADTTLQMGGRWGLARVGNTLFGNADSTHVNLGIGSTTGTNGQNYKYITVGGGYGNTAIYNWTTIGGGDRNSAGLSYATVSGGVQNNAGGQCATVSGGSTNIATSECATVAGGNVNTASNYNATVSGGQGNIASGYIATVGGGKVNRARGAYAVVSGGGGGNEADSNSAIGSYSAIGGGYGNIARGNSAVIGGGRQNIASSWYSIVGGGQNNTASNQYSTVGGGEANVASGMRATVVGGSVNQAAGPYSSILGGFADTITATGDYSYLFGINSNLTQDSTFMVDMPHVWFGTEANGYEFPYGRGTDGQIMKTNGSGLLSWGSIAYVDSARIAANAHKLQGKDTTDLNNSYVNEGQVNSIDSLMLKNNAVTMPKISQAGATAGQVIKWNGTAWLPSADSSMDSDWSYRVTDGADTTLQMGGRWGIARFGNTMYGNADSTHVNLGVISTTGTNGQNYKYSTVGGGWTNSARNLGSTVGGGVANTASNICATVGGGDSNTGSGYAATIAGGQVNSASNSYSTVGGGQANNASGDHGTISGGVYNLASGQYATVAGGQGDTASGYAANVSGGSNNRATGNYGTIAGGAGHRAIGSYSTVSGGVFNTASGHLSAVGGGQNNTVNDSFNFIGAGNLNSAAGKYSVILGGYADTIAAGANYSYLFGINSNLTQSSTFMVDMPHIRFGKEGGGGYEFPNTDGVSGQALITDGGGNLSWATTRDKNWTFRVTDGADTTLQMSGRWGLARAGNTMYGNADSTHVNLGVINTTGTNGQNYKYITVSGGLENTASNWGATVGGGVQNNAGGQCATVGGGRQNTANGWIATVAGGWGNIANGGYATVAGGYGNTASGDRANVAGGVSNISSGDYAAIGGGQNNTASNQYTTVGGGEANTASDMRATVAGGSANQVAGTYSSILGGSADTIFATGDYSYLFGINSNLTQDSTFMVDMPHVWFGTEANGYEFPYGRGTNGQALVTNGSGQVSWASTNDNDWVINGSNMYSGVSGNVGIGVTSPSAKLDIAGTVKIADGTQALDYVFTSDANGLGSWQALPAAPVSSVFGRTGAVVAASGDYTTTLVTEGTNLYFTDVRAQAAITGGASTITTSNLTANRALLSDGSGKVAVSAATNTELGYLSGVTSAIQTQLSGKQAVITGGASTITTSNLTANRALLSDGSGKVAVSAATNTELGYLSGVTSAIQTQLSGKASTSSPTFTGNVTMPGTGIWNSSGNVGIGLTSPSAKLDVAGTVKIADGTQALGYVFTSDASGLGSWQAIPNDNDWTFLVTDGADTTLQMGGRWGIVRFGNTMYGNADSTHVNLGVGCVTGTNGQDYKYCTVSGGYLNTASGDRATVSGGSNNTASGIRSAIGGGWYNIASNFEATVGGGTNNNGGGNQSTIAGGGYNVTVGTSSAIGGGYGNLTGGSAATVAGGQYNSASGSFTTVGGGGYNKARGEYSVVAGGGSNNEADSNSARGDYSAIGGGYHNITSGNSAVVSGGRTNTASNWYAVVSGGQSNTASGQYSSIGGGEANIASSHRATIAGGSVNQVSGEYSAILGGYADTIFSSAAYSYLFGINSNLTQDSTFLVDMPHIRFGTEAAGYEFPKTDGSNGQALITNGSGQVSWGTPTDADWTISGNNMYSAVSGNVGIGTSSPAVRLEVRAGTSDTAAIFRGNLVIQSKATGSAVLELGEGLDYAEGFDVTQPDKIKPGTVLVIDPKSPGKLAVSCRAYDTKVAGIVAGGKGLGSGVRLGTGDFDHNVALAGRVYCNVDASTSAVEPGDLLTTANTPGYAMKAQNYDRAKGAVLGKAMERLEKGQKGQILVLVSLQ